LQYCTEYRCARDAALAILIFMNTFILIADSGVARLLRVDGAARKRVLLEVARLECPPARRLPQELVSDRTGRLFARGNAGMAGPASRSRAGADNDSDPRAVLIERFAASIARRLDVERRRKNLTALVIIAAPHFLGRLRTRLSGPTRALVQRELARDLLRASDAQVLRAAFPR
jgi:protein required for attachment to host cells